MTERRAGELTDAELAAAYLAYSVELPARQVATAAYEKAMRRAAEICREHLLCADDCADEIERELK